MIRCSVAASWVANPAYGLWATSHILRQVRMRASVPWSVPPKKLAEKKPAENLQAGSLF